MDFMISASSDIGIRKHTNQDSALVQVANTKHGKAALGIVCDGMGGLAKGELASATLIKQFAKWFSSEFNQLLQEGFTPEKLSQQWNRIIQDTNRQIILYGVKNKLQLGTTLTGVLIYDGMYYCVNVGDSRTYLLNSQRIQQISKDHSLVQREIDLGRLTPEEALKDPQRNVLLQCVGASEVVCPDFFMAPVVSGDMFMMCSDGFRHTITDQEVMEQLNPKDMDTEDRMKQRCEYLIELNKQRKEDDNITVSLIKIV